MKDKIITMLERYADTDGEVTDATSVYDLGMNSLDLASFIGDVEDEFGCSIEEDKMTGIETVKDIISLIENSIPEE